MQNQELVTLLTVLKDAASSDDAGLLQKKIAPVMAGGIVDKQLQATTVLLDQSPAVFKALTGKQEQPISGAGILHAVDNTRDWFHPFKFTEFVSIYLASDPATPVLLLPVTISLFDLFEHNNFSIVKGSAWTLSKLLCHAAPTGTYTGLTVSGGTISFDQEVTLNNKIIIMPAGCTCTVTLTLAQPVDTTVPPDDIGIDAKNAQVTLPISISFNFSDLNAKITAVAEASWQLYGSSNTFQFDPAQSINYSKDLGSILLGCNVTEPVFIVTECGSPFFKIDGTAAILDGFWELPVAVIEPTQTNNAAGCGALAVVCLTGLQASWTGLSGGSVYLGVPIISAAPGIIGVLDLKARNANGSQSLNLWKNETTKRFSTLKVNYSGEFALYYLCLQLGEEFLSANVSFNAQVDRPLLANARPVEVKGTSGLLYQVYTPTEKSLLLLDTRMLLQNYPPADGEKTPKVPLEAIALTNALLTTTPVSGILLYGKLNQSHGLDDAQILLSFGLYYLLPTLPDPYAASFGLPLTRRIRDVQITSLPLSEVQDLLFCMIKWPVLTKPQVSFAISAIDGDTSTLLPVGDGQFDNQESLTHIANQTRGTISRFGAFELAMLDVSTNADLMGVSFSTMNIKAESEEGKYRVKTVSNADETGFLHIRGMDLAVPGKFVRAFTVPEISWEPVFNLSMPQSYSVGPEPPKGILLFGDDGGPTQIFNDSDSIVPFAPLPVSRFIVEAYHKNITDNGKLLTASLFTLPFGMQALALLFNQANNAEGYQPASLSIHPHHFDTTAQNVPKPIKKTAKSGLQIIAKGKQDPSISSSPGFMGFTVQLQNVLDSKGQDTGSSILGPDVDSIFNGQFAASLGYKTGVPLERIDFSGYGASIFSNWLDPDAAIAATSQAKFDVFSGRTALEIIQVKSPLYPWGAGLVRTITMYRAGSAIIYRVDSGWRSERDGVYDFSFKDANKGYHPNPYQFHPGIVKGVFNITNIVENDLPPFKKMWSPAPLSYYIDPVTQEWVQVPAGGVPPLEVLMQPVYFDADVQIDHVVTGAVNGLVPSTKMLGYVQLSPRGQPIPNEFFYELLDSQSGSLGGPVNCTINIGNSGQLMRLNRVEVSNSYDASGTTPVFPGTARGTVILPPDGSWSIVQHSHNNDAVTAIADNASVALIQEGLLGSGVAGKLRLANPMELLKAPDVSTIDFGILQNTGTQKVLFQLPAYTEGWAQLVSKDTDYALAKFADAFHLVNSTGIFPNPADMPPMQLAGNALNILEKGFKLDNVLKQLLPPRFYFVDTTDVKLYIDYNLGAVPSLNYNIDSSAKEWLASSKGITLNVDLGPFTKLVFIDGNFDSASGADSSFGQPNLQFGPDLQPIYQILEVLQKLSTKEYPDIGAPMNVAMGNSGDNFEYKLHADKEIATIQFPPAEADGPTTPLRLTAGLKVGAYFNESLSITSDPSDLVPSAGAYFEFDGTIQVMCVSLAAATVYAIGQVALKLSADTKTGPALDMKFGFGVELMVGLPVVGNVSVTYMAGVEINLTSKIIQVSAFLLFKGEASLIGGMVTITIMIEASGMVQTTLPDTKPPTYINAEVTFAIDISIFLVIDINFSKSWSETKQIA